MTYGGRVLKAFVTQLPALGAALLLFLQNRASGKREREDRKDERDAVTQREIRESERATAAADEQRRRDEQTVVELRRERYVTLLETVHRTALFVLSVRSSGTRVTLTDEQAMDIARALEDVLVSAAPELAEQVQFLSDTLHQLIDAAASYEETDVNALYESVQIDLGKCRDTMRDYLGHER